VQRDHPAVHQGQVAVLTQMGRGGDHADDRHDCDDADEQGLRLEPVSQPAARRRRLRDVFQLLTIYGSGFHGSAPQEFVLRTRTAERAPRPILIPPARRGPLRTPKHRP
jgi:hypothetical protein